MCLGPPWIKLRLPTSGVGARVWCWRHLRSFIVHALYAIFGLRENPSRLRVS